MRSLGRVVYGICARAARAARGVGVLGAQYPGEKEITFPPFTCLEADGEPRLELTDEGEVVVFPLKVPNPPNPLMGPHLPPLPPPRAPRSPPVAQALAVTLRHTISWTEPRHQAERVVGGGGEAGATCVYLW